jgi:hypothetical protein
MAGYSRRTAWLIKQADPRLLGVKLGVICVDRDIPVADVAQWMGVSRMAVYAWFRGESVVSNTHEAKVRELIRRLT